MSALRKIIRRVDYVANCTPHGGGSVTLHLECGHSTRRKRSQEPKGDRVRCDECADQLLEEMLAEEKP